MRGKVRAILTSVVALAMAVTLWMPITADAATETVEKPLLTSIALLGEANVEGGNPFGPTWVGMKITVGDTDMVVTEVGRYYTTASSTNIDLMILDENYEQLGNASVTVPEGSADGFVYAALDEKVTLQKNTSYYVVTYINDNNDMFHDYTQCNTTGDASIDGFIILEGDNWACYEGKANSWGPVDLKYEIEEEVADNTDTSDDTTAPDDSSTPDDTNTTNDVEKEDKTNSGTDVEDNNSSVELWVIVLAIVVVVAVVAVIVVIVQKKKKK